MRVGISLASAHPGASDAEAPRRMVERARVAAATGMHSLTVGDHHVTGPMPYVQNVPILGRLLAEWVDRPVGLLFLAPLWNAVLMAEQIGTLAALTDGPFIVQTGLGDRSTAATMGVDVPHRGERLDATIEVVQALLAGERVDDERLGIQGAAIAPCPPSPVEWWIGASVGPAMARAARLGTGWYANAIVTPESARAEHAAYVEACDRLGRAPGTSAVRKDVLLAESDAEATTLGDRLVASGYRGMPREAVAYGSPDHVAEQLAVYRDIGFTDVIIRTMTVPHDTALESVRLAGDLVSLLA